MAGSPPNFHKIDSRSACIQDVLKVKVKGHVIQAFFCRHENRFFSKANGRIATKLPQDGLRVSLHPGCAQGQGQGQRLRDTDTLCWHENRFFSQANNRIATKLAHDGLRVSVHPGCAQGQGLGQRSRDTRTFLDSWNMSYSVIDGLVSTVCGI